MLPEKINNSVSKEYKARNESIKIRDSERQNIEKVVLECCVYVGIIKEENVPQVRALPGGYEKSCYCG